jgi:ring-1,2-phenylacetyl-CoA epoxidase subunit PaaE
LNGNSSGDDVAGAAGAPSAIIMRVDGRRHTVKYHAGETLLETARRGRVPLGSGCEKGICGTCTVSVIAGRVRMRANSVLSDDDIAAGLALACQSVPATSELEIDLCW